jgi:predicted adenylyl cyclase CyaB
MNEIELKFKVDNKDKIIEYLIKNGCIMTSPVIQDDTIFLPHDENTFPVIPGTSVIRIRNTNNKKYEIALKRKKVKRIEALEIEFEVSNPNEVHKFIECLNFDEVVNVHKTRIETDYKDFHICFDEVKKLGSFIEIEIITDEEDKTDYYESKILAIAKELNINVDDRVNSRYDTLMYNLEHNN